MNNPFILTYTGKKFYPLMPNPYDVCIEDIAHALSQKCRFTGHTKRFYSVAEHSIILSHLIPEYALLALLHDAAEAYWPDIPAPLKECGNHIIILMGQYEKIIQQTILKALDVAPVVPDPTKTLDKYLCGIEGRELIEGWLDHWEYKWQGVDNMIKINCYPPDQAEHLFLCRYQELIADGK